MSDDTCVEGHSANFARLHACGRTGKYFDHVESAWETEVWVGLLDVVDSEAVGSD